MRFYTRRSLVLSVAAVLALCTDGAGAFAADNAKPAQEMVQEKRQSLAYDMANLVMSMLRDHKKTPAERMEALERGFAEVMDIEWIAKFALGASWRSATPEQRDRYTALYRAYLTKVYVENYAENSERKISGIKVTAVQDAADGNFTARTEIVLSDGARMKVDYLVRDLPDDNRIIDVVVEGVSLLSSHRAEFSAIAASKGVDAVIATLDRKINGHENEVRLSMNMPR